MGSLLLPRDANRRIIVPPAILPPPPGWRPPAPWDRRERAPVRWSPDIYRRRAPRAPLQCAFAHVQGNTNLFDGTGQTSIAVTLNGVTAGSLIVLRAKFEGVNSTASATDGTTAFTAGTKFWSANDSVGGRAEERRVGE